PPAAVYGYVLPLVALSAGGTVVLPDPNATFFAQASALGVTATGGNPAILAQLVAQGLALGQRLETIQAFEIMGTHLPSKARHAGDRWLPARRRGNAAKLPRRLVLSRRSRGARAAGPAARHRPRRGRYLARRRVAVAAADRGGAARGARRARRRGVRVARAE